MSTISHPREKEYDFVVIGGGSAGYAAARTAVQAGLETIVIEGGEEVGGLCILRGCMPSKTLIESANRMLTLRRAEEFGLRAENIRAIGPEILARKQRMVLEFADYRKGQLKSGTFDFLRGFATFADSHSVRVSSLEGDDLGTVRGRTFLLATGSVIARPDVPGLAETGFLTSDDTLDLAEIPESIIVLGGGAIALEAAHHLSALGSRVTLINRGAQVLREMDSDVAHAVEHAFRARGLSLHLGTSLASVERASSGQKRVHFHDAKGAQSVEAAEILVALGRAPATARLGLGAVSGLHVERERLAVDATQRTTAPHVFAAGDVSGPHEIVHLAIQQGEIAARNAARALGKRSDADESIDYRLKLFCVFTHPQIGAVGLTAREAKAAGIDFISASHPFADHGKSMVMGETDGFVKLLAERGTGRLIGGAVVGPEASELIHEIAVAMHFHATARDLAAVPHYHPTLSEIWTYPAEELMEAVVSGR